jgi:hypothetical protein
MRTALVSDFADTADLNITAASASASRQPLRDDRDDRRAPRVRSTPAGPGGRTTPRHDQLVAGIGLSSIVQMAAVTRLFSADPAAGSVFKPKWVVLSTETVRRPDWSV